MRTYIATIIKTNGVKVSKRYEASNEAVAYRKVLREWEGELKEVYSIFEV